MSGHADTYTLDLPPRGEWAVEIRTDDRRLLGIRWDGTWELEPDDAPEAARLFAELLAGHISGDAKVKIVEQADRIAWLEGEVAVRRIKLAECEERQR